MPLIGNPTDLVVIGGGFWGVFVALAAKNAGMSVILLDNGNPRSASRNAAGIVCKHWYKQNTIKNMLPDDWSYTEIENSIQSLEQFGLVKTGEEFSSYANQEKRLRSDCYLVPSCAAVTSRFVGRRTDVQRLVDSGSGIRVESDSRSITAKYVAIAAGAFTDELLGRSGIAPIGVRKLRGRAIIAKANSPTIPWTYMSRPYTHYTLRQWPKGTVRIGDTVERRLDGGDKQLDTLRRVLETMSPGAVEENVLDGIRPVCDKFTVAKVRDRIIVATGGHRVGLGLAGLVAARCLRLFD